MSCDNYTWTETYYGNGALGPDLIAGVQAVAQARAQLFGEGAQVVRARIILLANPRVAYFVNLDGVNVTAQNLSYLSLFPYADRPYSSIMVSFISSDNKVKRTYLSGVPDGLVGETPTVDRGIEIAILPTWLGRLVQFTTALNSAGLGWAWEAPPTPRIQIVAVGTQPAPGTELSISTNTQLVFPSRQKVIITGYRRVNTRAPGMNGGWYVDPASPGLQVGAVAPFVYYLVGTPLNAGQATNRSGVGFVAPLNPQLALFQDGSNVPTSYGVGLATHRKRGARALAPVGRSRSRG